eukprot:EST47240.1 Hypothetical protein SS50377_12750 [Spironucleus salmonicida]
MIKILPNIRFIFTEIDTIYIIKDVEMLRFSPALNDIQEIKILEDNSIFFPCDIAVYGITNIADLLERQRAKLHPSQPISLYSINQLSLSNFPLPIINRSLQPPLLHFSVLTAENMQGIQYLDCFSRATANYYIQEKRFALSFIGEAIKSSQNLILIDKSDKNRICGDVTVSQRDGMRQLEIRRKIIRKQIIQRLKNVVLQIQKKQVQVDHHCETLRDIGKNQSMILLWPVVGVMLKVDQIQVSSPHLGRILRGKTLSPAAINCGNFSIPIMLQNQVVITDNYYQEVLNAYMDQQIFNYFKMIGKYSFNSRNYECNVQISFSKKSIVNEIQIVKSTEQQQMTKGTKEDYFKNLLIQPENFKRFKLEHIEEQINYDKTVIEVCMSGCSLININTIIWLLRNSLIKKQNIEEQIIQLLDTQSILQYYLCNGWMIQKSKHMLDAITLSKGDKQKTVFAGKIK